MSITDLKQFHFCSLLLKKEKQNKTNDCQANGIPDNRLQRYAETITKTIM
jgi:hypothetical protein